MKTDDSELYTGMTGSTFGNEAPSETTQDVLDAQKLERDELKLNAQTITAVIQAERETISNFRSYMAKLPSKASAADIEKEYRARELYMEFLDVLESRINIKLREVQK